MAQDATDTETWVGSSLCEICSNKGIWSFNVNPVNISKYHAVLYNLPVTFKKPPEPHINADPKHWDDDYVRMPYSDKSLFPITENGVDVIKLRWKLIVDSLSEPINSGRELEEAIRKYNSSLPELTALRKYFDELDEEENECFFKNLLPKIISLALQLPQILPGSLPLLKKHCNRSVSLSQQQIASLLANAVLCTFPWRKKVANAYPGVNFVSLYMADKRAQRQNFYEKLKCIFNYFHLVTKSMPLGVVTFERKYIPKSNIPRWDSLDNYLKDTKVHIDSSGTIEDNGLGFLQVDFANKNVGGGVLGYGCVQEEIRFVICPELIIGRLFIEQLTDLEAVIVTGVQRYSKYSGYAETFAWEGPFYDETPYDEYGRRRTTVCIIDATRYNKSFHQFYPSAMLREVNKAFVGFSSRATINLAPVATGNWGCGAFQGSLYLKSLLQLMACNATGRHLIYYTFGNEEFKDDFYKMYLFLSKNNIKVEQLWRFLCGFSVTKNSENNLYSYIQQAFFDSKKQPTVKNFFKKPVEARKKNIDTSINEAGPSNSFKKISADSDSELNEIVISTPEDFENEDVIPGTPPEKYISRNKKIKNSKLSLEKISEKLPKTDIGALIDEMDGNISKKAVVAVEDSLLEKIEKLSKQSKNSDVSVEQISKMEIDVGEDSDMCVEYLVEPKAKRKISDYFQKVMETS